ncbi:hypothetical protein KGA66_00460 [Actinocrinis puniceicyclus]|uniref:HTH cro/C1-type domain-containing protein n=1 Tax=Actinocrinis puniceicyclus TaxID=977794 RepID=A0A8J7WG04_9ACTN|nr:hypothetical protein [Actinocrinis puniceicyclus]MBS2961496.1 hypothetical protein [Actinocrinis puniceicyclus]
MRTERRTFPRERHWICARRLRERRAALGLTQVEVSQALRDAGVPLGNRALSAMEHGNGLDLCRLPELAAVLDCTTTYLLGLTTDPHDWTPDPETFAAASGLPTGSARQDGTSGDGAGQDTIVPARGWILGPDVPDRNPTAG